MSEQDDSGEVGLFFRPRPRLGAMDPFRPHFGEKEIVVASVKAWCPEDGGHEFESEDLHVFSHFESAYIEVRCPIHGWKDATTMIQIASSPPRTVRASVTESGPASARPTKRAGGGGE